MQNAAGRLAVGLPSRLDAAPVRVAAGGDWASFALQAASAAPARRSGSTATYADALPGVDLQYVVEGAAVKEALVLRDARATSSFRWLMKTSEGVTARQTEEGGVRLLKGGQRVFALDAPWMKDSAAAPARSSKVEMTVKPVAGGYELSVAADRAWLDAPERMYPVTIDPTVSYTRQAECELYEATPTTSGCGDRADLNVGLDAASKKVRSFVEFDLAAITTSASVREAKLKLNLISTRTSASAPVSVHAISRNWTNAATWNTYDGTNGWTTAGGDFDATAAASQTVAAGLGPKEFNVVGQVRKWVNDRADNHGFVLKTDETTAQEFHFKGSQTSTDAPVLEVRWRPRMGVTPQDTILDWALNDRMTANFNAGNGNLMLAANDIEVAGAGLDLGLGRTYNAMRDTAGSFGEGWSGTWGADVRLYDEGTSKELILGDGASYLFEPDGSGQFKSTVGIDGDLRTDGTGWKLTYRRTGLQLFFNSSGYLSKLKGRTPQEISFSYASGKLSSITDTQGYSFSVTSNGSGRITQISGRGRTWSYGYGTGANAQRLTSYTDPNSKTTGYEYDAAGKLSKMTSPAGRVTLLTHDGSQRLLTMVRTTDSGHTTGPTWKFEYPATSTCVTAGPVSTYVKDPLWTSSIPSWHRTTYCSNNTGEVRETVTGIGYVRNRSYRPSGFVERSGSAPRAAAGRSRSTSTPKPGATRRTTSRRRPTATAARPATRTGIPRTRTWRPSRPTNRDRSRTTRTTPPGSSPARTTMPAAVVSKPRSATTTRPPTQWSSAVAY